MAYQATFYRGVHVHWKTSRRLWQWPRDHSPVGDQGVSRVTACQHLVAGHWNTFDPGPEQRPPCSTATRRMAVATDTSQATAQRQVPVDQSRALLIGVSCCCIMWHLKNLFHRVRGKSDVRGMVKGLHVHSGSYRPESGMYGC